MLKPSDTDTLRILLTDVQSFYLAGADDIDSQRLFDARQSIPCQASALLRDYASKAADILERLEP